jgi:hypothetical protein
MGGVVARPQGTSRRERLPPVTGTIAVPIVTSIIITAMDLANVPIVDAHCHAFDLAAAAADLVPQLTLSEEPLDRSMISSTLLGRRAVRELASFLDCPPTDADVARARTAAIARDRDGYFASLFADAGLDVLLCDTGHPVDASLDDVVDLNAFATSVGRRCFTIFRVELAAQRLLGRKLSFGEFLEGFDHAIDAAVADGAVGLKSVLAYLTGLDVELQDERAAGASYERSMRTGTSLESEKPLCDFLFVRALEKAIEHDVPLQVHTGVGDGPIFDLPNARPALLRRVLAVGSLRRATIVLTHAGYPWVEESGWLASQYDGVAIDLSEMVPFASSGLTDKLLGLLEMTPTAKLLFGTDGFNTGEIHWLGARLGRESLGNALETLVRSGWLDPGEVEAIAWSILRDNAIRLYRLPLDPMAGRP